MAGSVPVCLSCGLLAAADGEKPVAVLQTCPKWGRRGHPAATSPMGSYGAHRWLCDLLSPWGNPSPRHGARHLRGSALPLTLGGTNPRLWTLSPGRDRDGDGGAAGRWLSL